MRGINKKLHAAIKAYYDHKALNRRADINIVFDQIPGGYSARETASSIYIIKHQKTQNTVWRTDQKLFPNYAKSIEKF